MTPGLSKESRPLPHAASRSGETIKVKSAAVTANRGRCIVVSPPRHGWSSHLACGKEEHRLCQAAARGDQPENRRSRACLAVAGLGARRGAAWGGARKCLEGNNRREAGDPSTRRRLQILEPSAG